MRTGTLTWNGENSLTDHGIYISGTGTHNAAEADVTVFSVPGRNGDLVMSNNRYKNIQIVYPAFIARGFQNREQGIRDWLTGTKYAELEDTYDPRHFRLARPTGGLEFTPVRPDGANFQIVFDCDPRRFLRSGNEWQPITGRWAGSNPTDFDARPIVGIHSVGSGLEIEFYDDESGRTVVFAATEAYSGTVNIDCEMQDVYDADTGENLNYLFEVDGDFPVLGPGFNSIAIEGVCSSASVLPRWWEL